MLPSPCEEVLQAAKRKLLEDNCGTLEESNLLPLQSANLRLLLRGPQLRGGEGLLKRNLFLSLSTLPASGFAAPLRNVCAEAY
jgi:hypothetical protein